MTDTQKLSDVLAEARRSAERASSSAQDAASEASDAQDYANSAMDSANNAESCAGDVQEALDSVEELIDEVVAENERLTAIIAKIRAALDGGSEDEVIAALADDSLLTVITG
jgi:phage shock protein A